MEAIKHFIRTPKNREINIKIPDDIPENELIEIIMIYRKKNHEHNEKLEELKSAMEDELFLKDLSEAADDFKNIDSEDWGE